MRRTRIFSRSKPPLPPSTSITANPRCVFEGTQFSTSNSDLGQFKTKKQPRSSRHNDNCGHIESRDSDNDFKHHNKSRLHRSDRQTAHNIIISRPTSNSGKAISSIHLQDQSRHAPVPNKTSSIIDTHGHQLPKNCDNTHENLVRMRTEFENRQEILADAEDGRSWSSETEDDDDWDCGGRLAKSEMGGECYINNNIHRPDIHHCDHQSVSKGRGGQIESAFTESQGRSRPSRRVEKKVSKRMPTHTKPAKCEQQASFRWRQRQNMADYGPGLYFVRVLRETQNSQRDSAPQIESRHKLLSESVDYDNSWKDHNVVSVKDRRNCERVITEDTSDRAADNTESVADDNKNISTLLSDQCACLTHRIHTGVSDGTEDDIYNVRGLCIEAHNSVGVDQLTLAGLTMNVDTVVRDCLDIPSEGENDDDTLSTLPTPSAKPTAKRKKRRRSKRRSTSLAALSSAVVLSEAPQLNPGSEPSLPVSASTGALPQIETDSGVDLGSQSSLPSSTSCPSLEQIADSRSSSAERLRRCSSPSFTYDPEIASQIPYYFTEPEVETYELDSDLSDALHCFCTANDAADEFNKQGEAQDDASSNCSWTEFDEDLLDILSDREDSSLPNNSVWDTGSRSGSLDICRSEDETSPCVTSEEALSDCGMTVSSDDAFEECEIDYDSYLPAHVLMHVKRDLVSVLMEYGQTREVKVSFKDMERSGPHHASRFHTAAIVDGETFPMGSGSSKKNAKKAAAAQALKIMYDRGRKNLEVVNEVAHKKLKAMSEEEVGSHAHRVVLVSRHVLDTAEETQFINYSKDKIAATFVLEYHGKMRVVGLGTGNRCILYQHMTLDGKRVIHSHAEIIARRAFMRYLYKQLLTYNGNRSHPIFTRSDTGKLKLRDKIQVHLYISRPPCGDAAAFPTISNFPNKMRAIRKQGQLRTIIDDGEGAIPTDFPVPAGANGKERLRIMTCSDKICRWNVLGVQGALLSHFLDPIYINSLVIGSHTGDQRGHVPRAVSGRLKCGRLHEVIQRPYRINSPDIHYPHDDLADNYNITKSKQYCITWSYGDIDAEVIDAITGVTNMETMEEVIPSRVAKLTMQKLFQQVCKRYGRHDLEDLDYLKAKRSAITFQRMKSFVGQHLAAMGFGQWYSLQDTYGTDSMTCPGPC